MTSVPHHSPMPRGLPTVLFDFDGTVCLGEGPVLAFARELDRRVPGRGFERAATGFLADPNASGPFARCDDPYDVVALVAADTGVPAEVSSAAYAASRAGGVVEPICAPRGLREFLHSLPAHLVLATNSPAVQFDAFLERLGLQGSFSRIITSTGKPAGLHPVLRELLAGGPVLSVGDKWVNDLAPARYLGAHTALIDTYDRHADRGRASMRARRLEDLYPHIRAWCDTAAAPILADAAVHPVHPVHPDHAAPAARQPAARDAH